jgi:hypothetical protein
LKILKKDDHHVLYGFSKELLKSPEVKKAYLGG